MAGGGKRVKRTLPERPGEEGPFKDGEDREPIHWVQPQGLLVTLEEWSLNAVVEEETRLQCVHRIKIIISRSWFVVCRREKSK